MRSILSPRKAIGFFALIFLFVTCTSIVLGQNDRALFNSLLFVQQDVVTTFGSPTGFRLGTVQGEINGTITVSFQFLPSDPGTFKADDKAQVIDSEGDQILFRVLSAGTFGPSLDSTVNPFSAPLTATYEVINATGKFKQYKGLIFPARGTAVIAAANPLTIPAGVAFTQVSRFPLRHDHR